MLFFSSSKIYREEKLMLKAIVIYSCAKHTILECKWETQVKPWIIHRLPTLRTIKHCLPLVSRDTGIIFHLSQSELLWEAEREREKFRPTASDPDCCYDDSISRLNCLCVCLGGWVLKQTENLKQEWITIRTSITAVEWVSFRCCLTGNTPLNCCQLRLSIA